MKIDVMALDFLKEVVSCRVLNIEAEDRVVGLQVLNQTFGEGASATRDVEYRTGCMAMQEVFKRIQGDTGAGLTECKIRKRVGCCPGCQPCGWMEERSELNRGSACGSEDTVFFEKKKEEQTEGQKGGAASLEGLR